MKIETIQTIIHEKMEAEEELDKMRRRLGDLKITQKIEESRATKSLFIAEKNIEINNLRKAIEVLNKEAEEVARRESALVKYNRYLEDENEQLERRLKAKDMFNLQYVNRTIATERLLEDSHFEEDVNILKNQMVTETSQFEMDIRNFHDENVLLKNLNKNLKSRAKTLIEEQEKKPNLETPALNCGVRHQFALSGKPSAWNRSRTQALHPRPSPKNARSVRRTYSPRRPPCSIPAGTSFVAKFGPCMTCPTCSVPYSNFNLVE